MIIPFDFHRNSRVLISGCGGGYDILCGHPIARALEAAGCKVFWSSYSFTRLAEVTGGERVGPALVVGPECGIPANGYFPELFFCQALDGVPVWCYADIGIPSLTAVFDEIARRHRIDWHILIDGGCDGIFRGDEYGLGTPAMDAISLIASARCSIPRKSYVMSAFGTEGAAREVAHAEALARLAELTPTGGFRGCSSILNDPAIAREFRTVSGQVFARMPPGSKSTIVASILAALDGGFGDLAVNTKTEVSPVWVSPLTALLWWCDTVQVANAKLYLDEVQNLDSVGDISNAIWARHRREGSPERPGIPI
jgi:hypothetical protein